MIKTINGKQYDSDALMLEILSTMNDIKDLISTPIPSIPSVIESKKKEKEIAFDKKETCRKAFNKSRKEYSNARKEYAKAVHGVVGNDNEGVGNLMFKKANLVHDFKYAFCKRKNGVVGLKYSEEMKKGKNKMKGKALTQSKPTTITTATQPAKSGGVLNAMGFGKSN